MPFSDLADRVAEVRGRIAQAVARGGHGQQVTIVAVTKTHGPDAVDAAHAAGIADVGENKVQEALDKMPRTSAPVRVLEMTTAWPPIRRANHAIDAAFPSAAGAADLPRTAASAVRLSA